jgi:hypothetical protein
VEDLVPPRRLGQILTQARESRGVSVDVVTEELARNNVAIDLREVEAGRARIDDRQVQQLARIYGIETGTLVPMRSRLIVDLSEGVIQDERTRSAIRFDPDRGETLRRYLALVYQMRNAAPGQDLTLRIEDMQVLAEAFGTDSLTIESELRTLMAADAATITTTRSRLSARVLVPAAGILLAVTAIGALVFVQSTSEAPAPAPAPAPAVAEVPLDQLPPAPVADVGPDAITVERLPDGSVGPERPAG